MQTMNDLLRDLRRGDHAYAEFTPTGKLVSYDIFPAPGNGWWQVEEGNIGLSLSPGRWTKKRILDRIATALYQGEKHETED